MRVDVSLRRWRVWLLILVALAATVWLVTTAAGRALPTPPVAVSPLSPNCVQEAAAQLVQAGLAGRVACQADGTLAVEMLLSADRSADQAAQAIWVVFDAAASLPPECSYRRLEVTVVADGARLHARVTAADLQAWAEGTLDEAGLVARVLYTREPLTPPAR
ncbi:MAG TPA: hypothetical protein ENI37_04560 [Chloroflexi bacterium]|nr:hypothetical protein [Chloroflexota bacterium]